MSHATHTWFEKYNPEAKRWLSAKGITEADWVDETILCDTCTGKPIVLQVRWRQAPNEPTLMSSALPKERVIEVVGPRPSGPFILRKLVPVWEGTYRPISAKELDELKDFFVKEHSRRV